ncbi:unnamed protein product [Ectocarpus sp. 8 AP-2014]
MPGYEERTSILEGAGAAIFKLVCDRATPEQWAQWLRAPLEHAACTGDHGLVEKLLEAGADASAGWRGCDDRTLLHAAAEGGHAQVVSALRRAGAGRDINAIRSRARSTPLHLAISGGHEAAAGVLMMAGADVNILDAEKRAPLHLAICGGHVGLAKDLLLSGANPNKAGSNGDRPAHLASNRGLDEVVSALAQRGADLDSLGALGRTPLFHALWRGHDSTVRVLLAEGVNVNIGESRNSSTALHVAATNNRTFAITALIKAGADIGALDSGLTPLHSAVFTGETGGVLTLLQLGADVHAKDSHGHTPLYIACASGMPDAADLLLRWGADETAVESEGRTPSSMNPAIIRQDDGRDRRKVERLSKLLARAPQDRSWRRRGFLVMCRTHQHRLRLVVEIPDMAATATGHASERPSRRARRGQVKVEVEVDGAHGRGGGTAVGSGTACPQRSGRGEGTDSSFDVVAAWLMTVTDEGVFRKIVGYL